MKWCNYFRNNLWSNTFDSPRAVPSPAVHILAEVTVWQQLRGNAHQKRNLSFRMLQSVKAETRILLLSQGEGTETHAKSVQIGKKRKTFLMRRLVLAGCIPQERVQSPLCYITSL